MMMTGYLGVSILDRYKARQTSYPFSAVCGIVLPVRPIMNVRSLLPTLENVLVGSLIDLFDLIAAEDDSLNCPVVMFNVVNLCSHRCNDTEIVASTLHTPP
jgi:hypothetical protein